jgi:glycosyltransferase involved in cell wall biosynthesis
MKILIVHGCFLQGASSNLFVYHACKNLVRLGHDVILVCQETDHWSFDIISEVLHFEEKEKSFRTVFKRESSFPGTCSLYRPNIGDILPVFLYESQSTFVAKEMSFMPEKDLETYIHKNVIAVDTILSQQSIDAIWAHHCVLQPMVVASLKNISQGTECIATIHGNGINCMKKSSLLRTYAIQGLQRFDTMCFTSEDVQHDFVRVLQTPSDMPTTINLSDWQNKMCVVPPGLDIEMFRPLEPDESRSSLLKDILQSTKGHSQMGPFLIGEEHYWETDVLEIFRLSTLDTTSHPLVLYDGRYLWTKGIQLIVMAIPLVLQKFPNARFVFTGFGPTQTYAETLISYLHHGREELYLESIQHPDLWDSHIDIASVKYHQSFLDWMQDPLFREKYFYAAKNEIKKDVFFTGYLDQPVLSKLIRSVDLTVFPFIVPETFGQAAIESFSSGILSLMTDCGAFSAIDSMYRKALRPIFPHIFPKPMLLDEELVFSINRGIVDTLQALQECSDIQRKELRNLLHTTTASVFSWETMIQKYLSVLQPQKQPQKH